MTTLLHLSGGAVTLELVDGRAELAIIDHDGNGTARFLSHRDLLNVIAFAKRVTWCPETGLIPLELMADGV